MELIKDSIRQFYSLLVLLSFVSFVLWIYFSTGVDGEKSVFQKAGSMYSSMLKTQVIQNNGLSFMEGTISEDIPTVSYTGGVQKVGGQAVFRDLFAANSNAINGEEIALYLTDIKGVYGDSVLEKLDTNEIENLQEIPAAFIYDTDKDVLYFHCSGTYTIYLKVYASNGSQVTYEFCLPVETE